MSSKKRIDVKYIHIIWIITLTAFINLFMFYHKSYVVAVDSKFYFQQAEGILSEGLMYYANKIATPYYWGYPSFIALIKLFHGGNEAIVFVQIMLAIVTNVLLYFIICKIIDNQWVAVLCCSMYCILIDVFWWNSFILSDGFAMMLEIICLYFFCQIYLNEKSNTINQVLFWITLFLFFTSRTNASSLVLVLVVAMICKGTEKSPQKRGIVIGVFSVLLIVLISAMLLVSFMDSSFGLKAYLNLFLKQYESGEAVFARPRFNHNIQGDLQITDIVAIILIRVKCYVSIWFEEFSFGHKLINLFTIFPVWMMSIFSMILVIYNKRREYYPFIFGAFSYFIFQILTIIDYDLRYRSPIFVLLIIISSYGVNRIFIWIKVHL